jgi:hypothetical protein
MKKLFYLLALLIVSAMVSNIVGCSTAKKHVVPTLPGTDIAAGPDSIARPDTSVGSGNPGPPAGSGAPDGNSPDGSAPTGSSGGNNGNGQGSGNPGSQPPAGQGTATHHRPPPPNTNQGEAATAGPNADTGTKAPVPVLRAASLAIAYTPKMKLGETKIITVHVRVNHTLAQVKGDIKDIIKQQVQFVPQTDSTAILTMPIKVYEYLKISIECDTADFRISPLTASSEQKLDTVAGNTWRWNIKAISPDKRQAELILKIDAKTPEGAAEQLLPVQIPVTIYFDFMDMIRGWLRYLRNHPEYTVPSVVIPVVVAIYKRRSKKGAAEPEPATGEA